MTAPERERATRVLLFLFVALVPLSAAVARPSAWEPAGEPFSPGAVVGVSGTKAGAGAPAADPRRLRNGDDRIHGFTFAYGYLWASTRTRPARVLRIDPQTLAYRRMTLAIGVNYGEDLVAARGSIWLVTWTRPARLVRVSPDSLEWEIAVTFEKNEVKRAGSLEYAYGKLWVGGRDAQLASVDPDDLSYRVYDYSEVLGRYQFHALTSGDGYILGAMPTFRSSGGDTDRTDPAEGTEGAEGTYLVWIPASKPLSPAGFVFIPNAYLSDDIVYHRGSLYGGSETAPLRLYRVHFAPASHRGDSGYPLFKAMRTVTTPFEAPCYGLFRRDGEIWAAYGGPSAAVVRFSRDLRVRAVYRFGKDLQKANEIAFHPSGGLAYVTFWSRPAAIARIVIDTGQLTR